MLHFDGYLLYVILQCNRMLKYRINNEGVLKYLLRDGTPHLKGKSHSTPNAGLTLAAGRDTSY
jgi:hypothetical protein